MNKSIISYLEDLPDGRRRAGQRHDQTFILLLVLMSTMSGYHGYRSIGDFITRNASDLLTYLKPKKRRLPTFYTVRRVIQSLDFDKLSAFFYNWASQHTDITEHDWLHVDGKAMKGTMSDYSIAKQRFINLVSVYSCRKKFVLRNALVDNSKQSEIPVLKQLIKVKRIVKDKGRKREEDAYYISSRIVMLKCFVVVSEIIGALKMAYIG